MTIAPGEIDEDFTFRSWPFYWLARAQGRYLGQMERELKTLGLDLPRWRVLMTLHEAEVLSVSQVAEFAIVKLPTMTKIIQRMQSDGLVTVRPRASDGRVTEVVLTEPGKIAGQQAWAAASRVYKRAFHNVGARRREALTRALEDLSENLR